ncbi:MAG: hypothetical protein Q8N23_34415 [Archangium sp.]|nr:hypothetical protein [Archangium sp.]
MLRAFIPGLMIGFCLAFAPSCGRQCTPANCLGCCTVEGLCAPGVATDRCGVDGAECSSCAGTQSCTNGACEGPVGTGGGAGGGATGGGIGGGGGPVLETRLRLFITSVGYPGNMGGLAGADAHCNTAAQAANKGGTWRAFLSSGSEDALARMAEVGPWYQETNTGNFVKTFNNKANLTTAALETLYVDEQGNGSQFSPSKYWSGTLQTGLRSTGTCTGWTTTTGSAGTGQSGYWDNDNVVHYCSESLPIVCFEQSREPRASALATTRKRVFITSVGYPGNMGGLAGADTRCNTAAQAANKGGTWKAFLSSSSEDALARMAEAGPWYQETNTGSFVKTFNNKANLTTAGLATLYVDEQGNGSQFSPSKYWSGTLQTGLRSTGTCMGWTTTTGSAGTGQSGYWDNDNVVHYCSESLPIVCFEQ